MDYLIKYVLENTNNVISEQYILPLFFVAFISSGIAGLLVGKYGKKRINKNIVYGIVLICLFACAYIWNFELSWLVLSVYFLGWGIFDLIFYTYKSVEAFGKPFDFLKNGIVIGPSLKTQIRHKIKIYGGNIILKIPAENEKNKKEWSEKRTTDEYASEDYNMPVEKTVFAQTWFFYNRSDDARGRVEFDVSVQKMAGYSPLRYIENTNLATSYYRFSNTDSTYNNGERTKNVKKNLLSEKWLVKNINGKPVINYRINDGEYAYYNLMHIVINENMMLTIRLYCVADSLCVEKTCEKFSQKIFNSWELCPDVNDSRERLSGGGHKNKHKDKHEGGGRAISQPVFEPFSCCLPDKEEFKIILRNNP